MLPPLFFLLCCSACLEPTPPTYELEEPFYLLEGEVVDRAGLSSVRVRRSDFRAVELQFNAVVDATVLAERGDGAQVEWTLTDPNTGTYQPPPEFSAAPGEEWSVRVALPDGTQFASRPETVPEPVPVDALRVVFEAEGEYDADRKRFVPQFKLLIDFTDPPGAENYYEWSYRFYEREFVCASCDCAFYDGKECVPLPCNGGSFRYDYFCESSEDGCFQVNGGSNLEYATDQVFSDGTVRDKAIGAVDFTDFGGILFEALQYGITREAYQYGKVITDIIDGSTGLNPTIPAALNGNIDNLNPNGITALGYVRAASVTGRNEYLLRGPELGEPIPSDRTIRPQPIDPPGVAPRAPCSGPGRTDVKPAGWPD